MTKKGFITCLSVFLTSPVWATNIIPLQSNYYYQLGGGSDISLPPVKTSTTLTLGGSANFNLGYECGSFNPSISLSNSINNIEDTAEGLAQSVVESATAAIGSLPMYLLEKADPEMYNLIQNGILSAQQTFHISMTSCQQAKNEIKQGKSPYQDWFSISESQSWKGNADAAAQGQSVDINDAYNEATQQGQNAGIPWVHGGQPSGGSVGSQVPIRTTYDVVVAGYNILVSPSRALDSNEAPGSQAPMLSSFWDTPDDAGDWATLVLGDTKISTSTNDSDHENTSGVGLTALLTNCPHVGNWQLTCVSTIQTNLQSLIDSSATPTATQLRNVSANQLVITNQVLEALRNQPADQQSLSVAVIAQEVGLQNLMDEALALRRVILAGSKAQPIANVTPEQQAINKMLSDLDKDMQNLTFEHTMRKQMMSNTLQTVLSTQSSKKSNAMNETIQGQHAPINNGAVYKEGD